MLRRELTCGDCNYVQKGLAVFPNVTDLAKLESISAGVNWNIEIIEY